MKEIQSLLKILSDGLKTIAQGIEAVSEKVTEMAKSPAAAKPKAAAKPQAGTSAPAAREKKPARKSAAKAPGMKTAKAPTAAEMVYGVISDSKEGVDTAMLAEKTGFDRKKIANTIYKLAKQGKIASVSRGVYVKA